MKVLGVVCSPCRGGNTARLVEAVIDGAKNRGCEAEIFYFGDLKVNSCRACDSCGLTGRCVQDDVQLLYDGLTNINVSVFGTPIYHDHVAAQAKIFIDRLNAYEWRDSFPRDVKAVVIITYEWDNPNGYDDVLERIKGRFKRYYRIETIATLKAYGTTKRPVAQRPDLLREAQIIGEK